MAVISDFLNPAKPYQQAGNALTQYFNQGQQYQMPFYQNLSNPINLQNEWMQSYQQSPHSQFMQEQAMNSGLNAASSMGLLGSTPALQSIMNQSSRIAAADRDNYLNQLMQKYQLGAGMSTNLANAAYNQGNNMAQMTYGQHAAGPQLLMNLLGMGLGAGATALGGPIGGALANKYIGPYGAGA